FGLPARWIWSDEWYEFDPPLEEGMRTVLSVDESSYDQTRIWPGQVARGTRTDHPVTRYYENDCSRAYFTALGPTHAAYDDATYLQHLYGGLWWATTGRGVSAAAD